MADKLTRETIEAIREAAGKATPGSREVRTDGDFLSVYSGKFNLYTLGLVPADDWPEKEAAETWGNAEFAAVDPAKLIALCDMALSPALTAARKALEAAEDALEIYGEKDSYRNARGEIPVPDEGTLARSRLRTIRAALALLKEQAHG